MFPLSSVSPRQRHIWKWLVGTLAGIAVGLGLTSYAIRGLTARCFDNPASSGSPALTVRDRTLTLPPAGRPWYSTSYAIEWSGVLYVPSGGPYRFALTSDDGSTLAIDGAMVVDNSGPHSSQKRDGLASLARGLHSIRIRYLQLEGDAAFAATWQQEGRGSSTEAPLATAWLFPEEPGPLWFALFRVGSYLTLVASASWGPVLMLFLSGAVFRFVWRRRLVESHRGGRTRRVAEQALTAATEFSVLASLAILAWVGWFGSVDLSLGPIRLAIQTLWAPGLALIISLAFGAWLKTSPDGRFQLPMDWAWLKQSATRALVNPARALILTNRATAIWVTLGVSVVLAALGLAHAWQQGLTGNYYGDSNWRGEPVYSAHDRTLTLRRPVHDFVDGDKPYSIDWRGFIQVDTIGEYEFVLTSIGRSELWIDGQQVIAGEETTGLKADRGALRLAPGIHAISVKYSPSPGRRAGFYAAWRRWPFGQARIPELHDLTTAVLLPTAPNRYELTLLHAGSSVTSAASMIGLLVVTALYLVACRRLLTTVREHHVHIAVLLALALTYYLAAFSRPSIGNYWGFATLERFGEWRTIALFAGIALAVTSYRQDHRTLTAATAAIQAFVRRTPAIIPAMAILGALIFFALRNEFVNSDGIMFRWTVPLRATQTGVAVNFDEMWESYLHGWFWYVTNQLFGWSVRLSYQVASSVAGGLFLIWAWLYARRLLPHMALPFVLLLLSGGYMQLFFGDVEHYTLVGVVIAVYYLVSLRFLQGEQHLAVPSAVLSLAMTFHLLAGFLLLSLAYLYAVAIRKRLYAQIASGILAFLAIFFLTMFLLGKPFDEIYQGQWGASAAREALRAGVANLTGATDVEQSGRWAWFAFDAYHWEQYNLLAQLFPANVLVVLLLAGRRIKMDPINLHLMAACLGMAIFQFCYKALLPVGYDWNLYANAAIPMAILVWRNLLNAQDLRYKAELILAWFLLSSAHSYAWIVANHQFAP